MSTQVFVDQDISIQADGAQSSRVPVPLPKDPYEAIRQAYLDGTDTESEPFEDPVETETPESPLTVAPPTSLPESTSSTLVPILRRTARMVVHVPPAMSPGLYASMAEVAAMFKSAIRKRFMSYYESLPSSSPPYLPSRKRYRGTPKLVEDDEEDEDEEIEESLDSDSVSEDAEDEGPTAEDEDPTAGDEALAAGDEGPGIGVESHGLDEEGHSLESDRLGLGEEEEVVPKGQQRAVPVVGTTGSGTTPESERPERVSASRQLTLTTWTNPEDATPATTETEGFLTNLGAQVEMQGGLIRDHAIRLEELSPALFESVSPGVVGKSDGCTESSSVACLMIARRKKNKELRLQLAEERRGRLELANIVESMRKRQES
ncbi:hypothetical protein Tco_1153190 [Tanacetum coccineum]